MGVRACVGVCVHVSGRVPAYFVIHRTKRHACVHKENENRKSRKKSACLRFLLSRGREEGEGRHLDKDGHF